MIRPHSKLNVDRTRGKRLLLFPAAVIVAWFVCGNCGYAQMQSGPRPSARRATQTAPPPPQITPPYDVSARGQAIVSHLNSVLRFYRESEAPIQRVGEPSDLFYRNQAVSQATQIANFAFQSAKVEVGLIDRSSQSASDARGLRTGGGPRSRTWQGTSSVHPPWNADVNATDASRQGDLVKSRESLPTSATGWPLGCGITP